MQRSAAEFLFVCFSCTLCRCHCAVYLSDLVYSCTFVAWL